MFRMKIYMHVTLYKNYMEIISKQRLIGSLHEYVRNKGVWTRDLTIKQHIISHKVWSFSSQSGLGNECFNVPKEDLAKKVMQQCRVFLNYNVYWFTGSEGL